MGTAEVNGAVLYREVAGEGEPLVLVHAGIADGRMWDGQFAAFARRYRVIRYDMRGFGKSEMVAGPYSHHADLSGLLDDLGIERASFVGCSMGGRTVIDFALENPGRAVALALVGPSVGGFESDADPPPQWDELLAAEEAGDLEKVSELEVRIWVDGPSRGADVVDPSVRDLVREMNLIALRNEATGLGTEIPLDPPAVGRLDGMRVPSMVIVGDLDRPEVISRTDLLERDLPDVRKVVMPGTAHLPNMEQPGRFNDLVLSFLEEQR